MKELIYFDIKTTVYIYWPSRKNCSYSCIRHVDSAFDGFKLLSFNPFIPEFLKWTPLFLLVWTHFIFANRGVSKNEIKKKKKKKNRAHFFKALLD